MIKREELSNPHSCLNKATMDEPVFVLRASDKLAPAVIELWATMAEQVGTTPAKLTEARELVAQMRAWPTAKIPD
jgi:hypothetical protein